MKLRLLLSLLLFCPTIIAGQTKEFTDFANGTAGNSLTTALVSAAGARCDGGNYSTGGLSNYTYASTPGAPAFPAPTTICGQTFAGNSPLSMKWATGFTPITNLNSHFPNSNHVTIGFFICADFDPELATQFQYSNVAVGSANLVLGGSGTGLALEVGGAAPDSNFLHYHGGACTSSSSPWRWVSIEFNAVTNNHKIWIYDAAISTLLFTDTRFSTQLSITGQTAYGISGGETQQAGHNIYWRNFILDPTGSQAPLLPALPPTHIWSGLIDPARATDWNGAGVSGWGGNGTIPSASWTQSGATLNPGVTGAQINTALAACGANQYVKLSSGTFTLTDTGINLKSNCVLRGGGASLTKIVFSGSPTKVCNALLCADSGSGSYPSPSSWYQWTAGYSQYGTSITLANGTGCTLGSTCPITPNSTLLVLDQCDDSLTGDTCTGGVSVDNGQDFNCSLEYNGTNNCSDEGGNNGNGNPLRFLMQVETIASINTSTGAVVLNRPLTNPNWASARTPHAIPIASISNGGIEDLSIDTTALSYPIYTTVINIRRALNYWVKGVSVINYPQFAVFCFICKNVQIEQNYFYGGSAPFNVGVHAVETATTSDLLIQNNIAHKYINPYHAEGPDTGSVWAYNLCIGENFQSTNIAESLRSHSSGDTFQLWEGNHCPTFRADDTHGTIPFQTLYRNFLNGWKICPTGTNNCGNSSPASFGAVPIFPNAYSRFNNILMNVLGEHGFSTTYKSNSLTTNSILSLGWGNGAATPPVPNDPIALSSTLIYGNWDVVTNATRFCGSSANTGWVATCGSTSEVPTGVAGFPNPLPTVGDTTAGQTAPPASLYLTSKPAWFQSLAYPPIGPDVSNGNAGVGICAGTLNTPGRPVGEPATQNAQCAPASIATNGVWGNHVFPIPAFKCYADILNGPVDGSGAALNFNADVCYAGAVIPTPTVSLSPPSPLNFGNQSVNTPNVLRNVSLTNTGGATLTLTTPPIITGGNSGDFIITNTTCGASLAPLASCTISLSFTPSALGTRTTTLQFVTNASTSPDNYTLNGNGVFVTAPAVQISMTGQANITGTHTAR